MVVLRHSIPILICDTSASHHMLSLHIDLRT